MTGTCSSVKEKTRCCTPSSKTWKSPSRMPLIGRLLRSITRTFKVTKSALILSVLFSSISALFGSGVGVGFGLYTGGSGGGPSVGAIRRPGPVSTGVGVAAGVGSVVRGLCCALVTPAMMSERVVRALNHTAIVPRRSLEIRRMRKAINNYLVRIKAQCQTDFGVRRDFSDAERTSWRWLEY